MPPFVGGKEGVMDPYASHTILVVGFNDGAGRLPEELRTSFLRRGYTTTYDALKSMEDIRAVLCYADWSTWRRMVEVVRMNMAEATPRQMAFIGFNIIERGVLRLQFLKLGMRTKPMWLRFFPWYGTWFHSLDERKIDIVDFLRRKPNGNGAHSRSSEEVSG